MYELNEAERQALRSLAEKYMRYALDPINNEKIRLWRALNRSHMIRPMVCIDQLPWNELNNNGDLNCVNTVSPWAELELDLRKKIYQWEHFPVDLVLNPYIELPLSLTVTSYGLTPDVQYQSTEEDNSVKSQHFTNLIRSIDDVEKIKDMTVTHHEAESAEWLQQAEKIFEGVAPVRQVSTLSFHLGTWDYVSMIMGVEQVYYDLIDRPELLHAVMERITHSVVAGIEQANALQVHGDNLNLCHCSHIFTDELLPECGAGKGSVSSNSWAFGLAQLFTSVSPSVFEEFELPYISRTASYFGMIYYGCCDRLDNKLDIVKRIPHVRKVSCSPWSKRDRFAEKIGPELIMSNKPSPAFLAVEQCDVEAIGKDLSYTIECARRNNVNLELILKDVSTVKHNPDNLTRWADTAMKLVNDF